jgi:hypothetical protein
MRTVLRASTAATTTGTPRDILLRVILIIVEGIQAGHIIHAIVGIPSGFAEANAASFVGEERVFRPGLANDHLPYDRGRWGKVRRDSIDEPETSQGVGGIAIGDE